MRARHRLGLFLLRREIYWEGSGEAWSRRYRSWLTSVQFADQVTYNSNMSAGSSENFADLGTDRNRRGMYTFFWRSAPHPGLTIFDAPDATAACTKRNRSNTPLQALTLLNDEASLEAARALADRISSETGDAARLAHAFRLVVSRPPSSREAVILARVLADQRKVMPERDAWVQLSRVLLNLDEFITRE